MSQKNTNFSEQYLSYHFVQWQYSILTKFHITHSLIRTKLIKYTLEQNILLNNTFRTKVLKVLFDPQRIQKEKNNEGNHRVTPQNSSLDLSLHKSSRTHASVSNK